MIMRDFTEETDRALDVLFKLEKHSSKKKDLLGKNKTIYLQIILFQTPIVPSPKRKFLKLCHSLYGDDPEICLFVPNRKTGVEYKKTTDEFIDFCVDHYTELLEKHKVKGIKTVMPVKQLRSEYGCYELRRKLVQRFDIFLCKNSLLYNPRFLTALGKIFKVANKEPYGIAFPKEDVDYDPEFNKNIQRALFASSFFIQPFSDNYSVPIGTLSNTKVELKENLKTVLEQLFSEDVIPGGFENVRAMNVWPSQSKPIPLYFAKELPVDMKQPRVKSAKKRVKTVKGELSTLPGKKVTVTPSGSVFISSINKEVSNDEPEVESDDDEPFDDGSDDGEEDSEVKVKSKTKTQLHPKKEKEDESASESEDDEQIEEKERRLLRVKREAEKDLREAKKLRTGEDEEDEEEEGSEDEDDEEKKENFIKKSSKKQKPGGKKVLKPSGKTKSGEKKKGKLNKSERKQMVKQDKMKKIEKAKQKANGRLKQKTKL